MKLLGAAIGSAAGAAIGGAVWVGVGYATGYEISWIAWGVGLVAGLGAAVGGKGQAGPAGGVIAAVFAITSILVAKYIVVEMVVNDELEQAVLTLDHIPPADEHEYWVSYICDDLIEERSAAGETIQWPAGADPDYPETKEDYPPEIWNDAAARWENMSEHDRQAFRDVAAASIVSEVNTYMTMMKDEVVQDGFHQSFGPIDIIFGLLALVTAFQVGRGGATATAA